MVLQRRLLTSRAVCLRGASVLVWRVCGAVRGGSAVRVCVGVRVFAALPGTLGAMSLRKGWFFPQNSYERS